jgi:hypothetical protein
MSRRFSVSVVVLSLVLFPLLLPAAVAAQGRGQARARSGPPPVLRSRPIIGVRSSVFMGSYFYDPFFFGPSPWGWRGGFGYPYGYFPAFNNSADVRVLAKPKDVQVFVDGFYAGVGDDFDGAFQRLSLSPGGHTIVLYLDGYETVRHNLYLRPGSTIKLHDEMERLPAGQTSEPPPVAPPAVAPPPDGTYRAPRAGARPARPLPGRERRTARQAEGFGALTIRVQPSNADVTVDGERWESSDEGQFDLNLSAGRHRVEVSLPGYRPFSAEVEVREGEPTPLNVSLASAR